MCPYAPAKRDNCPKFAFFTGDFGNSVEEEGSYWQIDEGDEGSALSIVLEKKTRLTPWARAPC